MKGTVKASGKQFRPTQEDRILQRLKAANGGWVPAPELAGIALQYCARIAGLRSRGYVIANETQNVNGVVHGKYRLVSEPAPVVQGKPLQYQPLLISDAQASAVAL